MNTLERGPEQQFRKTLNRVCAASAIVLGVLAIKVGQEENAHRKDVKRAFVATFIGEDGCLSGTSYETTDDVAITLRKLPGQEILTIDPQDAEPIDLKVIQRSGEQITFGAADYKTGGVLYDANCPGADEGY